MSTPDFYSLVKEGKSSKNDFYSIARPNEKETPDFYSAVRGNEKPQLSRESGGLVGQIGDLFKPKEEEEHQVPEGKETPQGIDYGYGLRQDGTQKGLGFFGEIPTKKKGRTGEMTELGSESNVGGERLHYPLIVPTLTREEIDELAAGRDPSYDIDDKALKHAIQRKQQGLSPFATPEEEGKTKLPEREPFWKKFGQSIVYQMKSGGPAGAPSLSPEQAKNIALEVGTIAVVEAAYAPLATYVGALKYGPRIWKAVTGVAQAATTGAAIPTVKSLADKGELPPKEEIGKEALTWAAIDAAMQTLFHISGMKGRAVSEKPLNPIQRKIAGLDNVIKDQASTISEIKTAMNLKDRLTGKYNVEKGITKIAESQQVKPWEVVKNTWNKVKDFFGKKEITPRNATPEQGAKFLEFIEKEEAAIKPKEVKPVIKKPVAKPVVKSGDILTKKLAEIRAKTQPKIDLNVKSESKTIEDTRGKGKIFHGSPNEIETPTSEHYSVLNYYGQGFYTTDALDIAKGYANRKGKAKQPTIYEVKENKNIKLFDMEKPISKEIKTELENIEHHQVIDESLLTNKDQSLRELYDEMRDAAETADEIQGEFETIQHLLERKGYNGLKHLGGLRTGNKQHEVKIYFEPEKSVKIKKVVKPKEEAPVEKPKEKESPKPLAKIDKMIEGQKEKLQKLRDKQGKKPATKEQSELIQKINKLELHKDKTERAKFDYSKLKDQKKYLLNKIDQAIDNPPSTDKVTIKVPDDGTFKIKNSEASLEAARKKIARKWPVAPLKPKEPTKQRIPRLTPEELKEFEVKEEPKKSVEPKETVVNSTFVPPQVQSFVNATIAQGKKLGKSQSEIGQMGWKAVAKWYGDKNYAKWISAQKWDKLGKELPKTVKEDMLYYRERTGNPFKQGDTFKALSERLSPENKRLVDQVIDKHFEEGLKLINSAKYLRPITPRELVRNIFVPHFYEGKDIDKKIMEAYRKLGKKFNTKNPFENKRFFLTFNEAFKEAGLKPRYTNIIDSVKAYDAVVSRLISNNELIGSIKEFEKENDLKVIRRKNIKGGEQYADALNAGWIPFYDPALRTVFDGTGWKVSDAPALIHPDLAESMVGIFQKKPKDFAPSISKNIGVAYDATSAALRNIAVNISGFHFVALMESYVGATKWKDLLHLPTLWKQGGVLLTSPKIMKPALEAGLKIDYGAEQSQAFMDRNLNKLNDWLRTKNWKLNPSVAFEKALLTPYVAYQNFLWKVFHPRLKINTWYQYRQDFLNQAVKNGETVTPLQLKEVEAQIAEQVNNVFGGQVWELQKYFNDPDVRKWMYRLVGFPDWSLSAIKQAGEGFKGGFRGEKGRRYWLKYALAFITFQNFINYMTTGHSTFENEDPKHRLDFALPEIKFTFKGKKYNLGRDENGRRYYSHFGKQMLEIGRYFTDTLTQLFNKSNPLAQVIVKQVVGYTPAKDGGFPVQGKFKHGEFKPWGAEKGFGQVKYRGTEILQTILPFSVRGFIQHPGASAVTLGSLPVTKSLSLFDAKKFLEKEYYKAQPDQAEIRKIQRSLKDGGYTDKQIMSVVRTTRTQVNKDKRDAKKK